MSFSTETKTELINQPIHKKCCRKALLAGLIFDGETDGNGRMIAVFSNEECALFASKILSLEGYTVPYKPVRSAPNRYELAFTSENGGALARFPQELGIKLCAECVPFFVRGLLISKCSITDPEKQYHFEMLFEHSENAEKLMSFFEDLFGTPLLASRKNGVGLVYKNSSVIEDILSVTGAKNSYFNFVNGKIMRDLRNNANRATNCETRNIAIAVAAAEKQIDAIQRLIAAGELDALPSELRETADLRVLYPLMSLSELAARHCPPISKSGINHRIKKIMEAADKL